MQPRLDLRLYEGFVWIYDPTKENKSEKTVEEKQETKSEKKAKLGIRRNNRRNKTGKTNRRNKSENNIGENIREHITVQMFKNWKIAGGCLPQATLRKNKRFRPSKSFPNLDIPNLNSLRPAFFCGTL